MSIVIGVIVSWVFVAVLVIFFAWPPNDGGLA